ncbi:MAG: TlpA family protein disulfide reductase [Tannerellaceae bacterium]|jgi:thiol-disulfide isomerase/thioredoxin|nr:TlpA family protein disulfide reductase [Tannerellaceae bacterium]
MKKISSLFFFLLFAVVTVAQEVGLTIHVSAANYPVDSIALVWFDSSNSYQRKTISLKDGEGKIHVAVPGYTPLYLINQDEAQRIRFDDGVTPPPSLLFFAEEGDVTISFDQEKWPVAAITGGELNTAYMRLWKIAGPLAFEDFALRVAFNASGAKDDGDANQRYTEKLADIRNTSDMAKKSFISENPAIYVSLFLLEDLFLHYPVEAFEEQFLNLSDEVRGTALGIKTAARISEAKALLPNQLAPDFSKTDQNGDTIRLSSYRGKYVLIAFWGTWCLPCRKLHPHLVELYNKYTPLGIEFINVAMEFGTPEQVRDEWIRITSDDHLTWTQILNNEGIDDCDVVKLYAIQIFPTKVLIDADGKIVGRYTGETQELDEKLGSLFGQ